MPRPCHLVGSIMQKARLWYVNVFVADLGRAIEFYAYEELGARGVRFTMPPQEQPWGGFMAMFTDPDGNIFYLDQLRDE